MSKGCDKWHLGGGGTPPQTWDKSWQVCEKVGRFGQKVGRLWKKLAGLGKKLAGWGKSWQVCKNSWQVGKKVGRLRKKLAGCGLKIRSWQVVKRCQNMKVRILQVITNWRYGVLLTGLWNLNYMSTLMRNLLCPRPRTCYIYMLSENEISL